MSNHSGSRRSLTASPGAKTSGLIRESEVGPYELNTATVSMPTPGVTDKRVSPDVEAPTARTFLAMAGLPIVHVDRRNSPSLPAERVRRRPCRGETYSGDIQSACLLCTAAEALSHLAYAVMRTRLGSSCESHFFIC